MTNWNQIGKWSFILGLVIAILAAFVTVVSDSTLLFVLFILGLLVGFLNIASKDSMKFLLGLVALFLIGVSSLGALAVLGSIETFLVSILENFLAFVGAAGLVVSVMVILETSR